MDKNHKDYEGDNPNIVLLQKSKNHKGREIIYQDYMEFKTEADVFKERVSICWFFRGVLMLEGGCQHNEQNVGDIQP